MVHHGHERSLTPERDSRRPARAQRATKQPRRRATIIPPHCAQKPRSAHTERGLRAPTATPRPCLPPGQQRKPRSAHTERGLRAPTATPRPCLPPGQQRKPRSAHTERGLRAPTATPRRGRANSASFAPGAHVRRPANIKSPVQRETERGFLSFHFASLRAAVRGGSRPAASAPPPAAARPRRRRSCAARRPPRRWRR